MHKVKFLAPVANSTQQSKSDLHSRSFDEPDYPAPMEPISNVKLVAVEPQPQVQKKIEPAPPREVDIEKETLKLLSDLRETTLNASPSNRITGQNQQQFSSNPRLKIMRIYESQKSLESGPELHHTRSGIMHRIQSKPSSTFNSPRGRMSNNNSKLSLLGKEFVSAAQHESAKRLASLTGIPSVTGLPAAVIPENDTMVE